MNAKAESVRGRGLHWRVISAVIVGVGVAILIAANAHLVYVALKSQPDCVPHVTTGEARAYAAAQSAC